MTADLDIENGGTVNQTVKLPDIALKEENGKVRKKSAQIPGQEDENPLMDTDCWDVTKDVEDEITYTPWSELTVAERVLSILWIFTRLCIVILSLYLFVCSLSFLSSGFQLLGGKTAGQLFGQGSVLTNPIVGLMMGVLVTVLVQSSSTSTSIIVAMISSRILKIRPAINLIMGANIGTTVTNTIVSMGQSIDRKQFRRAFAGATVHDCFNWLNVCVFLPLEYIFHPIEKLSSEIVKNVGNSEEQAGKLDFLKKLTDPLTKRVVQVDKKIISKITKYCSADFSTYDAAECKKWEDTTLLKPKDGYIFSNTGLSDALVGLILLISSLLLLCVCLTVLVKTLQSLLLGKLAKTLKKYINSDLPWPFKWLTGYLFMVIGVGMTILVQSSSVFTSTLTPLVGMGVISLDRMFPLTLGSNIGTTATSMLAAFAGDSSTRHDTIQIAVCHLLFNVFGIILFYPIPFMRSIPLSGAKCLGNITAKYRWFAVTYLLIMFLIMPLLLLALSFNGIVFIVFFVIFVLIILFVVALNLLQKYCKNRLPEKIQTWDFLPLPLHSLKPYDKVITSISNSFRNIKCCKKDDPIVIPNPNFQEDTKL